MNKDIDNDIDNDIDLNYCSHFGNDRKQCQALMKGQYKKQCKVCKINFCQQHLKLHFYSCRKKEQPNSDFIKNNHEILVQKVSDTIPQKQIQIQEVPQNQPQFQEVVNKIGIDDKYCNFIELNKKCSTYLLKQYQKNCQKCSKKYCEMHHKNHSCINIQNNQYQNQQDNLDDTQQNQQQITTNDDSILSQNLNNFTKQNTKSTLINHFPVLNDNNQSELNPFPFTQQQSYSQSDEKISKNPIPQMQEQTNQQKQQNINFNSQFDIEEQKDDQKQNLNSNIIDGSSEQSVEKELDIEDRDEIKIIKKDSHVYQTQGIEVLFPYKLYPGVQTLFIDKMIEGISKKHHTLLEMPTGTGKTLCVLTSVLAYMVKYPKKYVLLYVSRTHTQVKQLIKQLRQTSYKPKISTLASREKLCINEEVRKNSETFKKPLRIECKIEKCNNLCNYYKKDKEMEFFSQEYDFEIRDIEELVKYGEENHVCPYYLSKKLAYNSDIIFAPYAYALQWFLLKDLVQKIQDKNKEIIIVFDEGHNISDQAEEALSFQLNEDCVDYIIRYLSSEKNLKYIKNYKIKQEKDQKSIREKIDLGIQIFQQKSQIIYNQINNLDYYYTKGNGQYRLNEQTEQKIQTTQKKTHKILLEPHYDGNIKYDLEKQILGYNGEIELEEYINMKECFDLLYQHMQIYEPEFEDFLNFCQKILLVKQQKEKFCGFLIRKTESDEQNFNKKLKINCLEPSIVFQKIKKSCLIFIISGSLSPLDTFSQDLNIKFQIQESIPHTIENNIKDHLICRLQNQCFITYGEFNFEHQNRQNQKIAEGMYVRLGKTLLEYIPIIPGGMVIFFSSYDCLKECKDYWLNHQTRVQNLPYNNLYEQINYLKPIYEEPKSANDITKIFNEYQYTIQTRHSAIMMAVCRGRLSEGIDFSDGLARSVFLVSVPNLNQNDLEVKIKIKYINRTRGNYNIWYETQTIRAMNQAAGRIIRHNQDYGALFLVDSRFDKLKSQLSKWIKPIEKIERKDKIIKDLNNFFKFNKFKNSKINVSTNVLKRQDHYYEDYVQISEQDKLGTTIYMGKVRGHIYEYDKVSVFIKELNQEVICKGKKSNRSLDGQTVYLILDDNLYHAEEKIFEQIYEKLNDDIKIKDKSKLNNIFYKYQLNQKSQVLQKKDLLSSSFEDLIKLCDQSKQIKLLESAKNIILSKELEGIVIGIDQNPYKDLKIRGLVEKNESDNIYWFYPLNQNLPKMQIYGKDKELNEFINKNKDKDKNKYNYYDCKILEWNKVHNYPRVQIDIIQNVYQDKNEKQIQDKNIQKKQNQYYEQKNDNIKNDVKYIMDLYEKHILSDQGLDQIFELNNDDILYQNNINELIKIQKEQIQKRKDHYDVFTIDSDETVQFDDAISIQFDENLQFATVALHIIDASCYIPESSELDQLAYQRTSNVYLSDRRMPMIPIKIQDFLSLNPGIQRLAVSIFFQIKQDGQFNFLELKRTVVKNIQQMSYQYVQDVIDSKKQYLKNSLEDLLRKLFPFIQKLKQQVILKYGMLDFDEYSQIKFYKSHLIMKQLKQIANIYVSNYLIENGTPTPIILNQQIQGNQLNLFKNIFNDFGLVFDCKDSFNVRQSIESALNSSNEKFSIIIKQLIHKIYSASRIGFFDKDKKINQNNFGMGTFYTQWTSPIRRYIDLVVQRQLLQDYLYNKLEIEKITLYCQAVRQMIKCIEKQISCQKNYNQIEKEIVSDAVILEISEKQIQILITKIYNYDDLDPEIQNQILIHNIILSESQYQAQKVESGDVFVIFRKKRVNYKKIKEIFIEQEDESDNQNEESDSSNKNQEKKQLDEEQLIQKQVEQIIKKRSISSHLVFKKYDKIPVYLRKIGTFPSRMQVIFDLDED